MIWSFCLLPHSLAVANSRDVYSLYRVYYIRLVKGSERNQAYHNAGFDPLQKNADDCNNEKFDMVLAADKTFHAPSIIQIRNGILFLMIDI